MQRLAALWVLGKQRLWDSKGRGFLGFGALLSGFLGLRRDVEVEGFRVQGFWVF